MTARRGRSAVFVDSPTRNKICSSVSVVFVVIKAANTSTEMTTPSIVPKHVCLRRPLLPLRTSAVSCCDLSIAAALASIILSWNAVLKASRRSSLVG